MSSLNIELSVLLCIAIVLIAILYKKNFLLEEANKKLNRKLYSSQKALRKLEKIHHQELENYCSYINEIEGCKEIIETTIKENGSFHLN